MNALVMLNTMVIMISSLLSAPGKFLSVLLSEERKGGLSSLCFVYQTSWKALGEGTIYFKKRRKVS